MQLVPFLQTHPLQGIISIEHYYADKTRLGLEFLIAWHQKHRALFCRQNKIGIGIFHCMASKAESTPLQAKQDWDLNFWLDWDIFFGFHLGKLRDHYTCPNIIICQEKNYMREHKHCCCCWSMSIVRVSQHLLLKMFFCKLGSRVRSDARLALQVWRKCGRGGGSVAPQSSPQREAGGQRLRMDAGIVHDCHV